MHGSTNWLTGVTVFDENTNDIVNSIATAPESVYIYEYTEKSYNCYDGRFMDGYQPFSYGYYPPNLPDKGRKIPEGFVAVRMIQRDGITPKGTAGREGILSMPLIIPPIKQKSYDFYGNLFKDLWKKAEVALTNADEIHIYGYSFPKTDIQTEELFLKSFFAKTEFPKVIVINPDCEYLRYKFKNIFGIYKNIEFIEEYIDEKFDFDRTL